MRRQSSLAVLALALFLLVACGPQQTQTLPTLIPTFTLPPTTDATEQAASTATRRVPPAIPPTWTPAAGATEASEPTATTESSPIPQVTLPTPLEVCGTFGEDSARNARSFALGTSPQVFWTAVQGTATYHVSLVIVDLATPDAQPQEVFGDFTTETGYTFAPDLFVAGKYYGWEVYPVDSFGQQMCLALGAELFPTGS